jgi:PncC family amidohydrolase
MTEINSDYINSEKSGIEKSGIEKSGIEKSGIEKSGIEKSGIDDFLTVSVAESVSAGAVSNILCSEPGSSKFFYGGIIAYNMISQQTLLGVDNKYAEKHNFANHYTTLMMAKNISKKFNSRIGISNTGFSLPTYRDAEKNKNGEIYKCKIDVRIPFAYICIYDNKTDFHKIYHIENENYCITKNQKAERAIMQVLIAKKTKEIFKNYCNKRKNI